MEKENRYTVHSVSKFEYFSNPFFCDIALEHQSDTMKQFINVVNISPIGIEIIAAAVGSNDRHHSPTSEKISMK